MKKTLKLLNRMVKDGVIREYAIGGAVAAIYYLEPFDTADLDIFVQIDAPESELIILAPIYEYLRKEGHKARGELVYVEGLPVQFLPVFNPLTDEALVEANTITFARVTTRLMRAEHLVAIMLDTGCPRDYLRIAMFLEQKAVDMRSLKAVLRRFGLTQKWKENEHKFKL